MSYNDTPNKRATGRRMSIIALASCGLAALSCGGCWVLFGRDELLATFSIRQHYTLNIYAEPAITYEPPGYIYFELKLWGQTQVPKRRFMGIGPERKPQQSFRLITSDDEEVIAILLGNDVQMMHEFSSGFTWPGPYTNITDSQWKMGELLLEKLRAANLDISCTRQDKYREELDRKRSQ